MVFQNYALYPHMTVFDNMAFSMKLAGRSKDEMRERVDQAAKILGLTDYLERYPRQLSGGQRQRVAMGRAIVRDPQVFLFDEPLSNLDAKLRVQMRTEIKELHQRLKTTSVYVTHDQIEAMTMADKIVVMNGGNVEQIGTPLELYDDPANLFVAGFIGSPAMNFLPGKLGPATGRSVQVARTAASCRCRHARRRDGRDVTLGVRPEHLVIGEAGVPAQVVVVEPTGADTQVYCKLSDTDVTAVSRERHTFRPGDTIQSAAAAGQDLSVRPGKPARGSPEPRTGESRHDPNYTPSIFSGPRGLAAGAALGAPMLAREAQAQELSFKPEPGAKLRVLRWKRFVQGDEDQWVANTQKFTEKTGVEVTRGQRELGRPAAQGRGRRERRQRPRHHSIAPTTTRTSIRTSCSTSATCASTSARNTAPGTRARSPTA